MSTKHCADNFLWPRVTRVHAPRHTSSCAAHRGAGVRRASSMFSAVAGYTCRNVGAMKYGPTFSKWLRMFRSAGANHEMSGVRNVKTRERVASAHGPQRTVSRSVSSVALFPRRWIKRTADSPAVAGPAAVAPLLMSVSDCPATARPARMSGAEASCAARLAAAQLHGGHHCISSNG